jgi:hypothetical protein
LSRFDCSDLLPGQRAHTSRINRFREFSQTADKEAFERIDPRTLLRIDIATEPIEPTFVEVRKDAGNVRQISNSIG